MEGVWNPPSPGEIGDNMDPSNDQCQVEEAKHSRLIPWYEGYAVEVFVGPSALCVSIEPKLSYP